LDEFQTFAFKNSLKTPRFPSRYADSTMNRILLIGATGNIGREVAARMSPANVRALVRKPAAANLPSGIELFPGDLTDPDSVHRLVRAHVLPGLAPFLRGEHHHVVH